MTKHASTRGALLAGVLFAAMAPAVSTQPQTLALTHVTIVDTTGGPLSPDMTVIVSDRRIARIEPSASAPVPAGAQVIDAAGKYLIPGLWDMHVRWYDEQLQAATINPARFMGTTDSLGSVGVGKAADLVLLDRNPLDGIRNTTAIDGVMFDGRWLDRAALDKLLAQAERTARS